MAELFATDHRGIFIPKDFAQTVNRAMVSGISDDMFEILEAGPDHEAYWDVWNIVLNDAVLTAPDGRVGFLWQDSDLWVIWGEEDPDFADIAAE